MELFLEAVTRTKKFLVVVSGDNVEGLGDGIRIKNTTSEMRLGSSCVREATKFAVDTAERVEAETSRVGPHNSDRGFMQEVMNIVQKLVESGVSVSLSKRGRISGEEVKWMKFVVIASSQEVVEDRGPSTAFPFGLLFHFYCFIVICIST